MIGNVQAIAKGGSGIVRDGDKTVFIPGVIAGETVEFAVGERRDSVWQGKLLRVLEASPQRVEPPCPHYRRMRRLQPAAHELRRAAAQQERKYSWPT